MKCGSFATPIRFLVCLCLNLQLHTWLPLEEVLCLDGCDLRHGGEDVGAVGGRPLQTVAVVDLPVARFFVHVELGESKTGRRQVTTSFVDSASSSSSWYKKPGNCLFLTNQTESIQDNLLIM